MIGQLELWSPGWEVEPCGHSDPDPDGQAFTDLHGRQPQPRAYRTTVTHHHPRTCCDRDQAH